MIMKKIFLILLFASFFGQAQNKKDFLLVWTNNSSFVVGDIKYNLPQFEAQNFEFDVSKKTIKYSNVIRVEDIVSESDVTLSNIVFETIDGYALGDLNVSKISSKLDFKSFSSYARDEALLSFDFNPIIKDGSGYKRVKSFTLEYVISGSKNSMNRVNSVQSIQNSVLANGN